MLKPIDMTCPRCNQVKEKWINTNQPQAPICCERLMIPNAVQLMGYRTDHTVHGD